MGGEHRGALALAVAVGGDQHQVARGDGAQVGREARLGGELAALVGAVQNVRKALVGGVECVEGNQADEQGSRGNSGEAEAQLCLDGKIHLFTKWEYARSIA